MNPGTRVLCVIADALKTNRTITRVILGIYCLQHTVNVLKETTFESLEAQAFADALKVNSTLTQLHLRGLLQQVE